MGHRAADPVVGYELEIRGGEWVSVGRETSRFDDSAEEVELQRMAITASEGDVEDYVELALEVSFPQYGPVSAYRVRAVNGAGAGDSSERVGGRRVVVQPAWYQWQRSAGLTDEAFEDIPGADTPRFHDTEAHPGHFYHYRLTMGVQDMEPATTESATGFRASDEGYVVDSSVEPKEFCERFLATSECRCDEDHDVYLCFDWTSYYADDGHHPAFLVVSDGESRRALRIVEVATYEDGDTHGAHSRLLAGFRVVETQAGLYHVEVVSGFHSFETMVLEGHEHALHDERRENTIHAIVSLGATSPRLLAIADGRHLQSRVGAEGVRELKSSGEWPENLLYAERDMEVVFDRDVRIENGGSALLIDDRRFELGGAPVLFPLRGQSGEDGDRLSDAFIAP